MASVTSVAAVPTTVSSGQTSTVTPTISNNTGLATVTVAVDGTTGSAPITLSEPLTFTVDQTKIGVKGYVVGTLAGTGSLVVASGGTAFTYTAV